MYLVKSIIDFGVKKRLRFAQLAFAADIEKVDPMG